MTTRTDDAAEQRVSDLDATGAAILGLLALRPWTTYQLTKQTKRSLRWFWNRAERKLYNEPKALVRAGYAEAAPSATGRRPSTIYSITPAGREALSRYLAAEGSPATFEIENLIRVFFGDQSTPEELRRNIGRLGSDASDARRGLCEIAAAVDMADPMVRDRLAVNALAIRLVYDLHGAIEEWSRWASDITADWKDTVQPPWSGLEVFEAITSEVDCASLSEPDTI